MNKLLSIVTGMMVVLASPHGTSSEARAIVDRIEENYAIIEFSTDKTHRMVEVNSESINGGVSECMEIPITKVVGKFYCDFRASNYDGYEDVYYQFRSDDDEVWWALTAEEMGFAPDLEMQYALYFTDNGTTKDNPPCDCPAEYECECYCYDDIFLGIEAAYRGK